MAKITYEDKEFLNKNESIADKNKVNDTDLNQIKEVVNGNDDKIGNLSDLNTADKSSIVNSVNSLEPVILYNNESGTNSNFSLNDDVSNYKYIEVYTKQNNYTLAYKCQKIYNPNGKNIAIDYLYYMNDKLYGNGVQITFSGKNATLSGGFGYTTGAGGQYVTASNTINIVRVIGYK